MLFLLFAFPLFHFFSIPVLLAFDISRPRFIVLNGQWGLFPFRFHKMTSHILFSVTFLVSWFCSAIFVTDFSTLLQFFYICCSKQLKGPVVDGRGATASKSVLSYHSPQTLFCLHFSKYSTEISISGPVRTFKILENRKTADQESKWSKGLSGKDKTSSSLTTNACNMQKRHTLGSISA